MPRAPKATPLLTRFDNPSESSAESSLENGTGDLSRLEWLETDGLGGYASSSVSMCPTRRYHGLLVGRPPGSAKRHVFLSRFDEKVHLDGQEVGAISMAAFGETISPQGAENLTSFELAPHPRFTYRLGEMEIVREILSVKGSPTVLVRYSGNAAAKNAVLELRPLVPMREADALTVANEALDDEVTSIENGISLRPYASLPTLSITSSVEHAFEHDPVWYRGLSFEIDRERGYPSEEDQFSPGTLRISLDRTVVLAATTSTAVSQPDALWRKEAKRRKAKATEALEAGSQLFARTRLAAEDFLYRTPTGRLGVTAGFPWFGEWGRDTFLSLPGLTLAREDFDGCADALSGALEFLQDGLLPNVFGTNKEDSAYNSADASLWFARAVQLFDQTDHDSDRVVDEYFPALVEIAESYREGISPGIEGDEDELLRVGTPDHNPTWMDALTSNGPVTPRDGFPVEINALWYALLDHIEELCERTGDKKGKKHWGARRRKAKRAFNERFWLADDEYLADVWKDGKADRSVRPNMVIAAALASSPLTRKQRAGIVQRAEAELLTDRGLRTLSPRSADYLGRYEGDTESRDNAYHQGTVWPWLLGFYGEAKLRATTGSKKQALAGLRECFEGFAPEIDTLGLNHVSEVYDGDAPRRGAGTFAQAWNTAELLRLAVMCKRGRS